MKLLDYGSGYSPRKNWLSSDPWSCHTDYHIDPLNYRVNCDENSFDMVRVRNVLHHIKDLNSLVQELSRITCKVVTIDVNRKFYNQNVFLDHLWYRVIIPRPEIWFSMVYRDYKPIMSKYFKLETIKEIEEKEIMLWIK